MNTEQEGLDERDIFLEQFEKATTSIDPDWVTEANCKDYDSDILFNSNKFNQTLVKHKLQKSCIECPVRRQCLDTIMMFEDNNERFLGYGFFAGTTPVQRVKLKKYEDKDQRYDVSTEQIKKSIQDIDDKLTMYRNKIIKLNKLKRNSKYVICKEHDLVVAPMNTIMVNYKKYNSYLCIKNDHVIYRLVNKKNANI